MKNFLKYGVVPAAVFLLLFCATVMLLPVLINVQKFLPQIENQISDKTGRPFRIGSDFGLTFFPWLSVTFSDAHLGNPKGVAPGDFISVGSFEARVKLLPLLVNRVEISRFIVSGLDLNLKREENGAVNWQLPLGPDGKKENFADWLLTKDLSVELFAVTGGTLFLDDKVEKKESELDDIMLILNGLSPDEKAKAEFKVASKGHVVKGTGTVGPLSAHLGSLFVDMDLLLNDSVKADVAGECSYPLQKSQCDLKVNIPPFSVSSFYGNGADSGENGSLPSWGKTIAINGAFHGDTNRFTVDNGTGTLDENSFTYTMQYNRRNDPPTQFEVHFTGIDATPYFGGAKSGDSSQDQPVLCSGLRSFLRSSFTARVGSDTLSLPKMTLQNSAMVVTAEAGKMKVEDGVFELHGGKGSFAGVIDVVADAFTLDGEVKMEHQDANGLFSELLGSSIVSGKVLTSFSYKIPGAMGSELGDAFLSKGYLSIEDGTLPGINLFGDGDEIGEDTTEFKMLTADFVMGPKAVNLQSLTVEGEQGKKVLLGGIDLQDATFTLLGQNGDTDEVAVSVSGSFGADGITLSGFGDEEEAILPEVRDVQSLVDEKIPSPLEEDVENSQGKTLIDAAVVAQRFGLKRELIVPAKTKKIFRVGQGRVVIHQLRELESVNTF